MKKIWLINSVTTFDNWKTSKKDVIFAESSEENAVKTIKKFNARRKEEEKESYLKDYKVEYIYEVIKLYD